MIQINLTQKQRSELETYRSTAKSENSERALMVLMSNDGKTPAYIAKTIKRHQHTIRDWLKRYKNNGISGLQRKYAPGKSPALRNLVSTEVEILIDKSPTEFGYKVSLWTTKLISTYLENEKGIVASQDTVERSLKKSGFTYRRGARRPTPSSLSKEEKKKAIEALVAKITEGLDQSAEVLALDESHFSTEPYVVNGWQKKLWTYADSNSAEAGENVNVWRIKFGYTKILLEERTVR